MIMRMKMRWIKCSFQGIYISLNANNETDIKTIAKYFVICWCYYDED